LRTGFGGPTNLFDWPDAVAGGNTGGTTSVGAAVGLGGPSR